MAHPGYVTGVFSTTSTRSGRRSWPRHPGAPGENRFDTGDDREHSRDAGCTTQLAPVVRDEDLRKAPLGQFKRLMTEDPPPRRPGQMVHNPDRTETDNLWRAGRVDQPSQPPPQAYRARAGPACHPPSTPGPAHPTEPNTDTRTKALDVHQHTTYREPRPPTREIAMLWQTSNYAQHNTLCGSAMTEPRFADKQISTNPGRWRD